MFKRMRQFCSRHKAVLRAALVVAVVFGIRTAVVHAGADTTFDDLNTMMTDWTKGSLGKALALIALLLGIGMAAARQSFASLFAGVGVAAGAAVGPTVISQVVTGIF